jgi:hypothetical protein
LAGDIPVGMLTPPTDVFDPALVLQAKIPAI